MFVLNLSITKEKDTYDYVHTVYITISIYWFICDLRLRCCSMFILKNNLVMRGHIIHCFTPFDELKGNSGSGGRLFLCAQVPLELLYLGFASTIINNKHCVWL